MSRREIQTAHSSFPKDLRLSVDDCEMLLFIHLNGAVPYDNWPVARQAARMVERLKRLGYLRRKYWPLRYGLSRSGFTLVRWLMASLEHRDAKSRA